MLKLMKYGNIQYHYPLLITEPFCLSVCMFVCVGVCSVLAKLDLCFFAVCCLLFGIMAVLGTPWQHQPHPFGHPAAAISPSRSGPPKCCGVRRYVGRLNLNFICFWKLIQIRKHQHTGIHSTISHNK